MQTSNGKNSEIKILPETASERAKERLGELGFNISLKEVGKNNSKKIIYELKGEKEVKLFFIFKKKMSVSAQIDAETDEIIKIKKPWWNFLSKEIDNQNS